VRLPHQEGDLVRELVARIQAAEGFAARDRFVALAHGRPQEHGVEGRVLVVFVLRPGVGDDGVVARCLAEEPDFLVGVRRDPDPLRGLGLLLVILDEQRGGRAERREIGGLSRLDLGVDGGLCGLGRARKLLGRAQIRLGGPFVVPLLRE
jgi:hypothetical protein